MKVTIVLTAMLFVVSCSTRQMAFKDREMTEEFNTFSSDRKGVIYFKDQTNIRTGKLLRIQDDEIHWMDEKAGTRHTAKISEIHKVSFRDRSKGANFGAAIGAGTCVFLIVVASAEALVAGRKETSDEKQSISSQIIAASYLIFGGASSGALIGFVKGYETTFVFE